MALTEEQLNALIGAAAENKVGRNTYFFSNDELVAMQERFLAALPKPEVVEVVFENIETDE